MFPALFLNSARAALVWAAVWSGLTLAQEAVYRCGNEYTNLPPAGQTCSRLRDAHVTTIEGTKPQASVAKSSPAKMASPTDAVNQVDAALQKQRDTEARLILQAELVKAETLYADLLQQWNNGEPERRGDELKNLASYQRRLAEMRLSLQRTQADIAGLRRELVRSATVAASP